MAIARADGSTAYSVGMHQITLGREVSAQSWPVEARERIFGEVVSEGAWINSIASEPELGSPQGGGRPATKLTPDGGGRWRLNGRKVFSTLAPVLTYFVTYAAIEDGSGQVCRVAVRRGAAGLRVETTWDGVGLRASGSDDVVYEDVSVADEDILVRSKPGGTSQSLGDFSWFALLVGGANLGIAEAARNYAVRFAQERKPTGYAEPIASIPHIRQEIARIDQSLMAARALVFEVADAWDRDAVAAGRPAGGEDGGGEAAGDGYGGACGGPEYAGGWWGVVTPERAAGAVLPGCAWGVGESADRAAGVGDDRAGGAGWGIGVGWAVDQGQRPCSVDIQAAPDVTEADCRAEMEVDRWCRRRSG